MDGLALAKKTVRACWTRSGHLRASGTVMTYRAFFAVLLLSVERESLRCATHADEASLTINTVAVAEVLASGATTDVVLRVTTRGGTFGTNLTKLFATFDRLGCSNWAIESLGTIPYHNDARALSAVLASRAKEREATTGRAVGAVRAEDWHTGATATEMMLRAVNALVDVARRLESPVSVSARCARKRSSRADGAVVTQGTLEFVAVLEQISEALFVTIVALQAWLAVVPVLSSLARIEGSPGTRSGRARAGWAVVACRTRGRRVLATLAVDSGLAGRALSFLPGARGVGEQAVLAATLRRISSETVEAERARVGA